MITMPKCKTGITELDAELGGGLPVGSSVLLSGASGTGKTTLCMQFLFNGVNVGEKGVFFTASEPVHKLKKHQRQYNFFDEDIIKTGKVSIIDLWSISNRLGLNAEGYTAEEANVLFEVIRDITKELGARRLVIDSITSLCYRLQTREMIRDFIFKIGATLAVMRCTTLMTSEIKPRSFKYSRHNIEEFIADGIFFLSDIERMGDLIRTFQVIKMRGVGHGRTKFVLNLSSKNGVELAPMLKSNI